ncbi:MAG: glycosyl transferase family protein [Sinobacterium sp.]|jgi:anthranilate phosphoribosyltransferase
MTNTLDFSSFIKILGKGKTGSRALDQQQAYQAMQMILAKQVEDVQLGAFLALLRVKEETSEELAGFTTAAREHINAPKIAVDFDWPSYAGKKTQHPWYILSALLLAQNGLRVFMHGALGTSNDRLYTEHALAALNITPCQNWEDVTQSLNQSNFAFMPTQRFSLELTKLLELKKLLALRSSVHSMARLFNPFNATTSLQGIFHPNYAPAHQQASVLLGQKNCVSFKGQNGEAEIRLEADSKLAMVRDNEAINHIWTRSLSAKPVDIAPSGDHIAAVWANDSQDQLGESIVINTVAIALYAHNVAANQDAAISIARRCWESRISSPSSS